MGEGIFESFDRDPEQNLSGDTLFGKNAYQYLTGTISDPVLQNVLSGTSAKLHLDKQRLPLYTFAQINSSFIQSAYRIRGGGMQIAEKLAQSITNMGGIVTTGAKATNLVESNGRISVVEIEGREPIETKYIISNIHPVATLYLAQNTSFIKKIYRKRISSLDNTFGMFTANIKLKPNTLEYLNRNIYIHETDDIWNEGTQTADEKPRGALVSYAVPDNEGRYAQNVDLLTPMLWSDVEQFQDSSLGHRPQQYIELKQKKAEQLIALADKYIKGFANAVESVYTSTPLTYRDYTATQNGSAFGIAKDYDRLIYTLLTPKTPIPNLWLTGQNLNLHGILGVSMTSFFSCGEILGQRPSSSIFNF